MTNSARNCNGCGAPVTVLDAVCRFCATPNRPPADAPASTREHMGWMARVLNNRLYRYAAVNNLSWGRRLLAVFITALSVLCAAALLVFSSEYMTAAVLLPFCTAFYLGFHKELWYYLHQMNKRTGLEKEVLPLLNDFLSTHGYYRYHFEEVVFNDKDIGDTLKQLKVTGRRPPGSSAETARRLLTHLAEIAAAMRAETNYLYTFSVFVVAGFLFSAAVVFSGYLSGSLTWPLVISAATTLFVVLEYLEISELAWELVPWRVSAAYAARVIVPLLDEFCREVPAAADEWPVIIEETEFYSLKSALQKCGYLSQER